MESVQHLAPGTLFASDFRIVRVLAQGGMGAVYEAEQIDGTPRRVALKLMHPSQVADMKLRRRFAQEARVGAWIGSEHIVEVFRAGVDEASQIPWLAMELLQGETLAARIAKHLPRQGLSHDDAWRVLAQLCRALTAAHDKGVVHRDLKPENVFLTTQARSDAPFTVKVLDFGIAKMLNPVDRSKNRTSAIGTPLWMAPEQNEDAEITPAADVWAFGLVCFRMFTGRFYWLSANEHELNLGWLYSELVSEALVPASQRADMLGVLHLLPQGFDAVFSRCVTRDPRKRFAHARELTDALAAIAPSGVAFTARSSIAPTVVAPSPSPSPAPAPSAPPAPSMRPAPTIAMAAPPLAPMLTPPAPSRRRWAVAGAALALLMVAAGVAWWAVEARSEAASSSPEAHVVDTLPTVPAAPAVPRDESKPKGRDE